MIYNYILIYKSTYTYVHIYIYIHKVGAPNFIKQTLIDIKSQIGPDTILGDFYSPLLSLDMSLKTQNSVKKLQG